MINKKVFDKFCDSYVSKLEHRDEAHLLSWEVQKNFQDNWDIEELDFAAMFDRSIHSNVSVRLWKRDGYFPKEMMLEFIGLDKEFSRSMFRDLFDENKDIDGRVRRFVYHCDIFLEELKKRQSQAAAHFHGDLFMPSLYLALRYPENYTTYSYGLFRAFMEKLEAKNLPIVDDVERYFKVMKVIQKLILQNEDLAPKLEEWIKEDIYYQSPSLFLAQDFEHYVLSC